MKKNGHGGDVHAMAKLIEQADVHSLAERLVDFSVNIRPEGPPDFLKKALQSAAIQSYPSPYAEEAMHAASLRHELDAASFVFGNGSNELIHALARMLYRYRIQRMHIIEPAFSEYTLACERAGLFREHDSVSPTAGFLPNWQKLLRLVSPQSAVIFANPGNPSGAFIPRESILEQMERYPDILWIADEAFIGYVGDDKDVSLLPFVKGRKNLVVLRSLTKLHALPGVRLGYAVAHPHIAEKIRDELPAWTVNAYAIAAAKAVFTDDSDFVSTTRTLNAVRRAHLAEQLQSIDGIQVFPSEANYILFHWKKAPVDLPARLIAEHGMAIRDCSNYHGLEDGTWFRAAVRFPDEHIRLATALRQLNASPSLSPSPSPSPSPVRRERDTTTTLCSPLESLGGWGSGGGDPSSEGALPQFTSPSPSLTSPRKPALMVQGTSSNAGKSILTAAFCRILRQDGYTVAPFKAQNMSLNSGVTPDGLEMGRAQIVQAQACRIDPDVRMNPVLLKPHSDTGSQVIVLGKATGHRNAREYFEEKENLWPVVSRAYDELAFAHDVMVLEGAGSPAEINLKDKDIVNMRMAEHAGACVLLVGDIDRGGVYASFLGTWMTFTPEECARMSGFLVNRFRGDASLLDSAHEYIRRRTGIPVLGVIPYIRDLNLPEEDMAGFSGHVAHQDENESMLDIAVIMLRHVSNYTDMAPLALEPDVRLRPVRRPEEWGTPDVVILPGSKSVAADLAEVRESGLAGNILEHAARGGWVFGICGGLQMMGKTIADPDGIESDCRELAGLDLLDIRTTFASGKILVAVRHATTPLGIPTHGYEIHHGTTEHHDSARPLFVRQDGDTETVCGYVTGHCWCTYLHGVFDDDAFRRAFVDHVRVDRGMKPQGRILATYDLEPALDRLADIVRESCNMKAIYRDMGLC